MVRRRGIISIFVLLLLLACSASPAPGPAGGSWVPFVARRIDHVKVLSGRGDGSFFYARDSHGSLYMRYISDTHSGLIRPNKGAYLYDRPHQITYHIDFKRKTIEMKPTPASRGPEYRPEPMSRQIFDQSRAGDSFLGRQVISGVECEGYRLSKAHRKASGFSEAWYAPSLNFMAIRSQVRHISRSLEDIQVGVEPDPDLFHIPAGFKLLK